MYCVRLRTALTYCIASFLILLVLFKVSFVLHWCWQLGNNPVVLPNLSEIPQMAFTFIFHLEFQSVELFVCHTACHNNQTFSQIKLDSSMV